MSSCKLKLKKNYKEIELVKCAMCTYRKKRNIYINIKYNLRENLGTKYIRIV